MAVDWKGKEDALMIIDMCLEAERNCTCEMHTRYEHLSERELQNIREVMSTYEGFSLVLGIVGSLCAASSSTHRKLEQYIAGTRMTLYEASITDDAKNSGTKN